MEISPLLLTMLLAYSFLWGVVIGLFYDINRIIRIMFGTKYSKYDFNKIYFLFNEKKEKNKKSKNIKKLILSILIFYRFHIFVKLTYRP